MITSSRSTATHQAVPVSRVRLLGTLLPKLPEELILEVLEYALSLPGCLTKTEFWVGECEWPSCHCQGGDWKHAPVKKIMRDTLAPLLAAPEPIPRLAELAFYTNNTFRFCGPQNDTTGAGPGVWLPPPGIRRWIQYLEVEVQIAFPRSQSLLPPDGKPALGLAPALDWQFLRRLQRRVHGFTALRTLKLMFEALFITDNEKLRAFDEQLGKIEPFCFPAQELIVETCSAYPMCLNDDVMTGDIIRDERLEKVLERFMSATGKQAVPIERCSDGEDPLVTGKEMKEQMVSDLGPEAICSCEQPAIPSDTPVCPQSGISMEIYI